MRRRIGSMLLVLCMMARVLMTGCGADNAEKKKGGGNNFTERPHDSNHTFTLRNIDTYCVHKFVTP